MRASLDGLVGFFTFLMGYGAPTDDVGVVKDDGGVKSRKSRR